MKKNRCLVIGGMTLVFFGVCAVPSCSRFSPATAVGQQIVDDFDTTVTNVNENIKTFGGIAKIDRAFSMRDSGDSVFSWLQRSNLAIAAGTFFGPSVSGFQSAESVFSYIEFRPNSLRNDARRTLLDTAYSIDSVLLTVNRFRMTIDSSTGGKATSAGIDVYSCDTLRDSFAFAFDRKKINYSSGFQGKFSVSLDSLAADSVYSVKLDSATYVSRIRKAVKPDTSDGSRADTSWFGLCLKPSPNSKGVVRFDNQVDNYQPRIIVYYRLASRLPSNSSLPDTTRTETFYSNHGSFTIFESDSSAACNHPVSSWASGRRAVFKLDVSSLRAYMDTAAKENKKFVVIQRADLKLKLGKLISDLFGDSVQVYYNLSDTLARNKNDFFTVSSFYVKNNANPDTVYTLATAAWFQKTIVHFNSDTAYLYLTIPTQSSSLFSPSFIQIDWTQPSNQLELKAILTNPR